MQHLGLCFIGRLGSENPRPPPERVSAGTQAPAERLDDCIDEASPSPLAHTQPLLRTNDVSVSSAAVVVASSTVHMRLLRAPRALRRPGDVDGAAMALWARAADGGCSFRIIYGCDSLWRTVDIDESARQVVSDIDARDARPDTFLTVWASPAQEPYLMGENICGCSVTPPVPPQADWQVTFFGLAGANPRVHARNGFAGPLATLALDASEIRWSNDAHRVRFAFDDALAKQKPAHAPKDAPAFEFFME